MSSQIVLSESFIRDTAHSLNNLLKIAEKTNFPFTGIKYPTHLTILNNICSSFGFSSVIGMSKKLQNEEFDVNSLEKEHFDLMHGLRRSNPKVEDDRLKEVHLFITGLYDDLINNPLDSKMNKLLSKLVTYHINPVVSHIFEMLDTNVTDVLSVTKEDLIKKSSESVFLYMSQLHHWGTFEVYEYHNFIKGDPVLGMLNKFELLLGAVETTLSLEETSAINFHQHLDRHAFRISFNPNVRFIDTVKKQLRQRLVVSLMNAGAHYSQSAYLLRSLLTNAKFKTDNILSNQLPACVEYENADDYEKDEFYSEYVMDSICWANSLVLYRMGATSSKEPLSHYIFDSNGLLSPKHFPTLFQCFYHEHSKTPEFTFTNLNQFYWAIQLLSAEVLQVTGGHHKLVAAKYILDIKSHFKNSAIVLEHTREIESPEFQAEYQKFRDAVFPKGFRKTSNN